MTSVCPACGGARDSEKYLCWTCWWSLPTATRIMLRKKDGNETSRVRRMYRELADGTPVQRIKITI